MAERKRDEDVGTSSLDMNNETWKDRLDLRNIASSIQLLDLVARSRQWTESTGFDVTKQFVNRVEFEAKQAVEERDAVANPSSHSPRF